MSKAGFVAIVGRPNAGKSTLLNALLGEKIALVSQKANATRKRLNAIVMHGEDQIIFVDTPGLHEKERALNQFMMEEALKAIGDCDLIIFLAPAADDTQEYRKFLELTSQRHIVVLNKIDQIPQARLMRNISAYNPLSEHFDALIPVSATRGTGFSDLLDTIVERLPESPHLFDPEDLTDTQLRDIVREMIRESVFENISDEIPYAADVLIDKIEETQPTMTVRATIIVEKESQKGIIIGKQGSAIKRIGRSARQKLETLVDQKVFLDLFVSVKPNWSNDRKALESIGYL